MRKMIFLVSILMMVSLLAACDTGTAPTDEGADTTGDTTTDDTSTDDSTSDTGTDTPDETDTSDSGTDDTSPDDSTEDTGTDTTDETDTSGSGTDAEQGKVLYEQFTDLVEKDPEYEITYEVTPNTGNKKVVTIYTKEGDARVDVKDQYKAWMVGNQTYAEAKGQCVDLSSFTESGYDPRSLYEQTTITKGKLKSEDEYVEVSSAGSKTLGGKSAQCFEFHYIDESADRNELTTYCVTDKGIPAFMETVDQNSGDTMTKIVAQSIEDSVSDSDLEPCEPSMEIPEMPG